MKHFSFATSSAALQEGLKAEKTVLSRLFFSNQTRKLNLAQTQFFFNTRIGRIFVPK